MRSETKNNYTDENITAYSYDNISHVTAVRNVLDSTASYAFDRNSNLISDTDAMRNTLTYLTDKVTCFSRPVPIRGQTA